MRLSARARHHRSNPMLHVQLKISMDLDKLAKVILVLASLLIHQ